MCRAYSVFTHKLFINSSKKSVLVLPQIASQVLALDPVSIRCKSRAWEVLLVGERGIDCGGVVDETITQMCEVYQS